MSQHDTPFVSLALHPHRLPSFWWFGLAAALVFADYAVGPYVQFAATFVIPVFLAAWYSGLGPAAVLALALPLARVALMLTAWGEPWEAAAFFSTAAIRICVFLLVAFLVARLAEHERKLRQEVEVLEGMLPICMHCKSIKN